MLTFEEFVAARVCDRVSKGRKGFRYPAGQTIAFCSPMHAFSLVVDGVLFVHAALGDAELQAYESYKAGGGDQFRLED